MHPAVDNAQHAAESIRVHGIVQGVGLRPSVYRLACERGLSGTVRNDSGGVAIVVCGPLDRIDDFVRALLAQAPARAPSPWACP